MPNVTQTVSNYLGGVSRQPDTKKLPGQVVDAINAYPDPTFGLTKRPGFKFIKNRGIIIYTRKNFRISSITENWNHAP